MEKRYDLTLDITHRTKNTNYILCSGDTVNSFDITLNDNGTAIDLTGLTARCFFLKDDGNYVENTNCTIASGIITVEVGSQETAYPGTVQAQLKLYESGTEILSSNFFTFKVNENLDNDEAVESTTEYSTLVTLIEDVEDLQDEYETINPLFSAHLTNTSNPHSVTKTQVGLGNVDNIQQMPLSYLDTTITLGTSDTKVPSQNATKSYIDTSISNLPKPLTFKGNIATSSDFPTLILVQAGWTYKITTNVTDNDVTKTNTGLSFLAGDEIAWDGSTWSNLGSTALWQRIGTNLLPSTSGDSLGSTGTRIFKGWFTDLEVTNTITGSINKSTNLIGGNNTTLLGSIPYQSNSDTTTLLAPNTTVTKKFLRQTGDGTNGAVPAWDTVTYSDTGAEPANANIQTHIGTTGNPHGASLANVGIGSLAQYSIPVVGASYLGDSPLSYNANLYYTKDDIRAVSTIGLAFINNTPATLAIPVQKPTYILQQGTAWDTDGSSDTWKGSIRFTPVSGSTTSGKWEFVSQKNSDAETTPITLTTAGNLTITGSLSVGNAYNIFNASNQAFFNINVGYASLSATISRNTPDAYSVIAINNANATSTGHILDLQSEGVTNIYFTKLGMMNLPTTTSTAGQILINGNRYFHAYSPVAADSNLFIGYSSGNFTMAGTGTEASYNVGLGRNTLSSLTTGTQNTAFGYISMTSLTTGKYNIGIGHGTLTTAVNAERNVAIGYYSQRYLVDGQSNVGIGMYSLYSNISVSGLVSIGYESLYSNTTGTGLVAVGYQAGKFNVKGTNNTYLGYQAGYSNLYGTNGVYIGYLAGKYETANNKLFIDAIDRTSEATDRTNSLIYGVFDATPANQTLTINGVLTTLGYKSSDGSDGITATKTFMDGTVTNTVTIKNGLITSWTQV